MAVVYQFIGKARTALSLGLPNLARVFAYKAALKAGTSRVLKLRAELVAGPFFSGAVAREGMGQVPQDWKEGSLHFGWFASAHPGVPPAWHTNPFNGKSVQLPLQPWWCMPDFSPELGDIKVIWEASRFGWVLEYAQRAVSGSASGLDQLNEWLQDWCVNNPPYLGPNWKCGQEAALRVMHLAMGAVILGQERQPTQALLRLVEAHLARIAPTMSYAIAQDNNHGSSEAAALLIGGSWLDAQGLPSGRKYMEAGRRCLENRVARLVEKDGTFSQYSVTYHRLFLDTVSMAELWRRRLGLASFSDVFYERSRQAAKWLHCMVCSEEGDVPNVGANDGARLLPLAPTGYRDFRPSVQLAMALFAERLAYPETTMTDVLKWLDIEPPQRLLEPAVSQVFDDGGFAVLREGEAMALLRYPRFRFRPSQSDALHVDFWINGSNRLRDAGTYSYNADARSLQYFPGTESHNTVQFDGADQMPRLSRFLFGDWLTTHQTQGPESSHSGSAFGAAYRNRIGHRHSRQLALAAGKLRVQDEVGGFAKRAVLRWRLRPGDWRIEGNTIISGSERLSVTASVPVSRFELVQGWESRLYLNKTEVPVLEVEIAEAGTFVTEYRWEA